jgi:hypothetical protein
VHVQRAVGALEDREHLRVPQPLVGRVADEAVARHPHDAAPFGAQPEVAVPVLGHGGERGIDEAVVLGPPAEAPVPEEHAAVRDQTHLVARAQGLPPAGVVFRVSELADLAGPEGQGRRPVDRDPAALLGGGLGQRGPRAARPEPLGPGLEDEGAQEMDDPEPALAIHFQVEHPVVAVMRQDRLEGGPPVGQAAQQPLLGADP